jgi:hypothetical protein
LEQQVSLSSLWTEKMRGAEIHSGANTSCGSAFSEIADDRRVSC